MAYRILLVLLLVPFALGLLPAGLFFRKNQSPALVYVSGWFVTFALFELCAVPFILLEKSFSALVSCFSSLLLLAVFLSLFFGRGVLLGLLGKQEVLGAYHRIKAKKRELLLSALLWMFPLVLVAGQLWCAYFLEYYDGDDAYYIAVAVMTDTFDTMYIRDPYTGYIGTLDIRHALSPTPVFEAWMARLTGIHVAKLAHSVLSVVWLVVMYLVYFLLGKRLFPQKPKAQPVFLGLLALWYAFGNVSLYTQETFAMTRTWQGKGLLAGLVLPCFFLCFLHLWECPEEKGGWLLLVCLELSGVLATSISFMLLPTLTGLFALLLFWKKKKPGLLVRPLLCCAPCLVLGACYLLLQ